VRNRVIEPRWRGPLASLSFACAAVARSAALDAISSYTENTCRRRLDSGDHDPAAEPSIPEFRTIIATHDITHVPEQPGTSDIEFHQSLINTALLGGADQSHHMLGISAVMLYLPGVAHDALSGGAQCVSGGLTSYNHDASRRLPRGARKKEKLVRVIEEGLSSVAV